MTHEQRLKVTIAALICGSAESLLNDSGTDFKVARLLTDQIFAAIKDQPFPVRIEVRGGVAEETESSPYVLTQIIDHDN